MKKGKAILFACVAASALFVSCDKEKKLADRLEEKWNITSWNNVETEVIEYYGADGELDSSVVQDNSVPNVTVTTTTTGTMDFVSEDNVVIETSTKVVTTVAFGGSTTSTTAESDMDIAYEYFATGEDEVTFIMDEDFVKFDVTTNEKKSQTWVTTDVDKDTDYNLDGSKEVTKTTTVSTISIEKIED